MEHALTIFFPFAIHLFFLLIVIFLNPFAYKTELKKERLHVQHIFTRNDLLLSAHVLESLRGVVRFRMEGLSNEKEW